MNNDGAILRAQAPVLPPHPEPAAAVDGIPKEPRVTSDASICLHHVWAGGLCRTQGLGHRTARVAIRRQATGAPDWYPRRDLRLLVSAPPWLHHGGAQLGSRARLTWWVTTGRCWPLSRSKPAL